MSKEIKSRAFALDPTFNYLPDHDRYLLALGRTCGSTSSAWA